MRRSRTRSNPSASPSPSRHPNPNQVFENLRQLQPAPNVQMHHAAPDASMGDENEDEDEPDSRINRRQADSQVQHGAEFYDGAKGE